MGRCGECFADTDCTSGSCNIPLADPQWFWHIDWSDPKYRFYECNEKCDGKHHCHGRGEAEFDPLSKTCTCTSCDAGWKGDRCEVHDCTLALPGGDCKACDQNALPSIEFNVVNKCQASDGETYLCQYKAPDKSVPTCGISMQKHCDATVHCGDHGSARLGDATMLCYCVCQDGWFGPRCTLPKPPAVVATDTGDAESGLHLISVVSNENNRPLRMQTCESPTCTGNPDASNTYHHSHDWLPPRLETSLYIRKDTTYIVFVDTFCPMTDFEIWRPKGGWKDLSSIQVPFVCGKKMDLGGGSMMSLGGYDPGQLSCSLHSDCVTAVFPCDMGDGEACTRHQTCENFNAKWCKSGKIRENPFNTLCVGQINQSTVHPQPATCSLELCCLNEDEGKEEQMGSNSFTLTDVLSTAWLR